MGKCILAGHPPVDGIKIAAGSVTGTGQAMQIDLGFKPLFFFIRTSNIRDMASSDAAVFIGTGNANFSPSWTGGGTLSWNYSVQATDSGFRFSPRSGIPFDYFAVGK